MDINIYSCGAIPVTGFTQPLQTNVFIIVHATYLLIIWGCAMSPLY